MFKFSTVFGPSADQNEVFEEFRPVSQAVVGGLNAIVFSYGQVRVILSGLALTLMMFCVHTPSTLTFLADLLRQDAHYDRIRGTPGPRLELHERGELYKKRCDCLQPR